MKKFLIVLIFIPILIWGIWIAIPQSVIQDRIEGSINNEHFSLETDGLKKKLFYKVAIDSLTLKGYGEKQISFKDIQAPINLLALLSLKLNLSFDGNLGQGKISGNIIRTLNENKIDMKIKDAPMNDIPFLKHAGIEGLGKLSGTIDMVNNNGHIEFIMHDAVFQPLLFSGITVPLNFFNNVRGALDVKGDTIHVSSIALEGKDIYARIKGEMSNNVMDLSMEIMPERSFLDNPIFTNALKQYKVSPGYYVIYMRKDLYHLINS